MANSYFYCYIITPLITSISIFNAQFGDEKRITLSGTTKTKSLSNSNVQRFSLIGENNFYTGKELLLGTLEQVTVCSKPKVFETVESYLLKPDQLRVKF